MSPLFSVIWKNSVFLGVVMYFLELGFVLMLKTPYLPVSGYLFLNFVSFSLSFSEKFEI